MLKRLKLLFLFLFSALLALGYTKEELDEARAIASELLARLNRVESAP